MVGKEIKERDMDIEFVHEKINLSGIDRSLDKQIFYVEIVNFASLIMQRAIVNFYNRIFLNDNDAMKYLCMQKYPMHDFNV